MRRRMPRTSIALLALLVLLTGPRTAAQSGHALFQQALTKERAEGKLLEAIRVYERIAKEFASDRALVAKALMQIGLCYEKLGRDEARNAYERLVRDYGDQSDLAATARARLASLNRASSPTASTQAIRRVYEGPGIDWCNGLSSDVRYLRHPDWTTGNLAIADLRNGEIRRLTNEGTINQRNGEFTECSVFSPDDRKVAFFWQNKDRAELRVVSSDGSKPGVLYRAAADWYLMPFDWSRDGKEILVAVFKAGAAQILLVSALDGGARLMKHFEAGVTGDAGLRLSPDGRFIVLNRELDPASRKKDIFVVSVDGGRDSALVQHPADDYVLGWSPGGKTLFFASDRTGTYGVWAIDVEEGKPRGTPILAKADIGSITPVRLVNGTLYYTVRSQLSDVYIAAVDPDRGTLQAPPALARKYFSGSNAAPDWSPDGNLLAYRSSQTTSDALKPPPLVAILDPKTGEERQIRLALPGLDFNDGPRWSPDGRSLLVIGPQHSPQSGVWKVDIETGATTPLVRPPRDQWLLHALWSRDGNSVFYTIGNPSRIVRRDLATGKDLDLYSSGTGAGLHRIALSPDGTCLAFRSRVPASKRVMTLSLVPAQGGAVRELHRAGDGEGIGQPAWTPDGRFIYFAKSAPVVAGQNRPPKPEYWRITPDGRELARVELDVQTSSFTFSPDGRRIAFSSAERKSELWALENILSAPSVARRSARR